MEEPRDLHRLLVVLYDVDAEPAARAEAATLLIRAISQRRAAIDSHTRLSMRAALNRALRDARADLARAQVSRRREGHA